MSELFANIYELWGANFLGPFSDIMFQNDFYRMIFFYTFFTVLGLSILYYYVLDRPKTSKLWVWLSKVLLGGILAFIIAYVTVENNLYSIDQDPQNFTTDILLFSVTNSILAVLLIFMISILIKWKSPNSSHVPF
jgi:hypothetical protein